MSFSESKVAGVDLEYYYQAATADETGSTWARGDKFSQFMTIKVQKQKVLAINCCDDVVAVLDSIQGVRVDVISPQSNLVAKAAGTGPIALVVIGVSLIPIQRLFINQLKRTLPNVALLVISRRAFAPTGEEPHLRGEFILCDHGPMSELDLIGAIREVFPIQPCRHLFNDHQNKVVSDVVRIVSENYGDPKLNLNSVASELHISPSKLSRTLNQQAGISFRQLLRQVRIEEAKHILVSRHYRIKEVAMRVGFADNHYFSRSFKEVTGLSASEYEYTAEDFALS